MSEEQFLLQRVDNDEIKIANEVYSCRLSPFDADLQKVGQYLTQAICWKYLRILNRVW